MYGKHFTVITDHGALLFVLRENRSNKLHNSRLTRSSDRLTPFQFDIEQLPGAKMGLLDYISRHPNQKAKKVSAYDKEFIAAKLKHISASANSFNFKPTESAAHFNKLIQAQDLAHQITPQFKVAENAMNLISTHAPSRK